ncbi:MAG: LamG domain-containing protein, partial [Candidatus Nanoarchaeia archaeon]
EISSAGGGFLILIANEFWLEEDFISKATFLGKIILRGFNEYPNDFFKDKDKEQLIFHELGHAVFRHGHDESLTTRPGESSMSFIPPLFPSSIMNPRRINTVDYIQYRDFYLDSFFSQRDPAVYIDCNPSSPSLSPPIIEQKDKNIFDFISNLFSKFLFIFTNVPEEEPLLAPTVSTRLFINNQGPNFLTTGVCSPSFVITHEDYSGNLVNVDLDTLITLSGQGGGAFYSDPSCLNVISSVDILTGSSSAIFYYKPGLLVEELNFIADSLDSEQGELSISVFKSLYPPVNEPNITCGDGSLPCELCQGFNFNNGVCEALFTFECGGSAYEYGTLQECQLANAPPANLTSVTLTSSNSTTNYTSEDLIATVNPDVNPNLKLTYSWYRNNQSIAVLDMPFESNGGSEGSFVKDYTSFKNNGNVSEAVWVATGGYDGKGAYIFDGSNDYILVNNSPELILTQDFTITAWTKPREFTNEIIVCKGENAADPDYALDVAVGDRDIGFYDGTSWKQSNSGILAPVYLNYDVWNHIAFVYDGVNYKFYLNGVENGTVSKTGDIQTSLSDLMIGQQCQFGVNAYNGTLDEIKIYDNALSSQQIQNIYSNQFNLISNQETYVDDVWRVEVTSNDGVSDVNTVVSNDLLINSFCGDGQAGGSEQCDGFDLKDNTCLTQSFQHGTLTCNVDCTFNTGSCGVCYNGIQDGNETGVDCGGGYCADCPPASGTCPVGEIFIDGVWKYQQNLLKGRVTKNVEGVSYERIRSNVDEEVIVRITESIGDKTYLNSLSLIEINHKEGTEAYLDSNGKAWQINGEEKQLIINQEDLDNDKFGFELTVDSLDNAIILKGSLTDSIIESWREYWKDEVRVQCLPGLYTVLDSLSEETVNSFLRKEAGILVEANVNGEWQEVNNGDLILERNEEAFVVLPEGTEKVRVSYPDGAYEFDNLRVVNDIEEVEVREIKSSVAELNNFDEDYVIVTNDRPLVLEFSVDNVEGETYYFKSHGYYHYFEDFECESPSLRWDVALRYLYDL